MKNTTNEGILLEFIYKYMKAIYKYLSFILIVFSIKTSVSADTISVKYLPLQTGNIWAYDTVTYWMGMPVYRGKKKVSIQKDTIVNYKRYFYLYGFPRFQNGWYRTDTTTGSLYFYDSANSCQFYFEEKLVDSLSLKQGQYETNCINPSSGNYPYCSDTGSYSIFGILTEKKGFAWNLGPFNSIDWRYVKNFGLSLYQSHGRYGSLVYQLKGCLINGVLYGDTSTVGIKLISYEVPTQYFLYQNFPNPFNPTTDIKYQIVKNCYVKLVVYDILGREISVLVNEIQKSGVYLVDFDASGLTSGVYFYRLISENYTETKKMILTK